MYGLVVMLSISTPTTSKILMRFVLFVSFSLLVCNIIVHDKCLKTVALPCVSIAATLVKNPVAHVWSERIVIKRKFCNVCRKKIEDVLGLCCEGMYAKTKGIIKDSKAI